MYRTKIDVRYSETDKMGIVYHANYFPWFEVARSRFAIEHGMNYAETENRGLRMPLADCYCKFIKSAVYGDSVYVDTEISYLGVAKCRFDFVVCRASDEALLAKGYTTHAFTDTDLRPLNLKKRYPDVYEKLLEMRGETQ